MNWKFWTWPKQIKDLTEEVAHQKGKQYYLDKENQRLEDVITNAKLTPEPKYILRGWTEQQMRGVFAAAPDNGLYLGTIEQCDQLLMEGINELLNEADELTDPQLRQRLGELRGYTLVRDALESREQQAREDRKTQEQPNP